MEKHVFIEGMTCGHCKARVEKALSGIDGVLSATVDLSEKKAVVQMTADIANQTIIDAVDDAGYDVTDIQ